MIIGMTDPHTSQQKLRWYLDWLRQTGAEILTLSGPGADLGRCDALVLTGGGDVHPKFFGDARALDQVHEVDEVRDLFEMELIRKALELKLPVLGICRGAQVFNVAMGGTLIPDLQHEGFADHRKAGGGPERRHQISVEPGSLLHAITGAEAGEVNTYHHQAIGTPGRGLRVSARSADGVAEAAEWSDPAGRPFLLLVQWHPERPGDQSDPFSRNIIERFVKEAKGNNRGQHN